MGNYDRFEKLEMLGELDEKYIREAEEYLAQPDDIYNYLPEPKNRKFSWKIFTASAAVLMAGAIALVVSIMRSERIKPEDIITPAQLEYLDSIKKKIGTDLKVSYAVDKLNFIELDLPDDLSVEGFIDENRAVVIKEDTMTLEQTLEIYNVKKKTYSVIERLGADGRYWSVEYTDKDHIIYKSRSDNYDHSDELYLYDINAGSSVLIYSGEDRTYSIRYDDPTPVIADGKVYFTVSDHILVYDIESKTVLMTIDDASRPMRYKDDVIYLSGKNWWTGIKNTLSVSGQNDFPNSGDVYAAKNGLYSIDAWGKVTELVSGKEISPSRHAMQSKVDIDFACDFGPVLVLDRFEAKTYFIYYEADDKLLVFRNGDGFEFIKNLGWGIYARKYESDGTERGFIITDEDKGDTVRVPRPDPDEYIDPSIFESETDAVILEGTEFFKDDTFVTFLPTISAEDAFELERIDLDATEDDRLIIHGSKVDPSSGWAEFDGKDAALGGFFAVDHNLFRLIELYYGTEGYSYENSEWGYYDPKTREFTSLLKCTDNEVWMVVEITDDYLIFREGYNSGYMLIEISSLSAGGEPKLIRIGEGLTISNAGYIIGDDGMFYFNAFDADGSNWLYSYELASGRLSKLIQNVYPVLYSGELYYADNCTVDKENHCVDNGTVLRALSGKRAFRMNETVFNNKNIYKTKTLRISGNDYTVLYNALTDENIIGGKDDSLYANSVSDSLITISVNKMVLFDMANNRLVTYGGWYYYDYYGIIDGRNVVYSSNYMYWMTPK
ncbi:MAG: hypothetical protein K2N56_03545 [Oscillospiraceae bacterium]|nr:hypothetical protein [Oscillospiraceae bacterium]